MVAGKYGAQGAVGCGQKTVHKLKFKPLHRGISLAFEHLPNLTRLLIYKGLRQVYPCFVASVQRK
jgi:hypothetical protein